LPSSCIVGSPSSSESTNLEPPSPAHYHSIMCRISYIVYVYIKANTHRTRLKFAKAIEEIEIVRRDLPLHLSSSFPATEDDKQWETEHPWIPFQRYLIAYVIDFVLLSIARVLIPTNPEDDSANSRQLALQSASRILNRYATPVPRVYRLVWTVSAATVAAAVYISLDMLANSHDYRGDSRLQTINLLKQASVEFKKHTVVAAHAAKGSVFLDGLLHHARYVAADYSSRHGRAIRITNYARLWTRWSDPNGQLRSHGHVRWNWKYLRWNVWHECLGSYILTAMIFIYKSLPLYSGKNNARTSSLSVRLDSRQLE
jgi:hypothetical protein